MAVKKSTSGTGSSKDVEAAQAAAFDIDRLIEYVEEQRACLMDAEAVLDCALVAMDAEGLVTPHAPYYPGVIRAARDIVHASIGKLAPDQLEASIAREAVSDAADENSYPTIDANKPHGVKESAELFMH